MSYRGRLAPTPTGWLHLGHAATFLEAAHRATETPAGTLVLRVEDLDTARCRPEWTVGLLEDLRWLGLCWSEGPDVGGPHGPYTQSARREFYLEAWRRLRDGGFIYPCRVSRKDMQEAPRAPHEVHESHEPIFPPEWRPVPGMGRDIADPVGWNWRFRVPDGETISFEDAIAGRFSAVAGRDFGDFPVWRRDDLPAYELAVVVDDAAMQITEVVRGEDLLLSTCRQLLLYRALGWRPPAFAHTPLLRDATGRRLAKRDAAMSLRHLRDQGKSPEEVREMARSGARGIGSAE